MAHKTLVNGTAYEISGGKTLINGTAYSIDKGKTLVGGTAYEVGFGGPLISFTCELYIDDLQDITFYAEEGMTWAEFCDSKYNQHNGQTVFLNSGTYVQDIYTYSTLTDYTNGSGGEVKVNQTIINGGYYRTNY